MKKIILSITLLLGITCLCACSIGYVSSEPCSCGKTPTKAYQNSDSQEAEYYCKSCSSDCEFCSEKATEYYTSGLGCIIFVCDDCYQDILEMN